MSFLTANSLSLNMLALASSTSMTYLDQFLTPPDVLAPILPTDSYRLCAKGDDELGGRWTSAANFLLFLDPHIEDIREYGYVEPETFEYLKDLERSLQLYLAAQERNPDSERLAERVTKHQEAIKLLRDEIDKSYREQSLPGEDD